MTIAVIIDIRNVILITSSVQNNALSLRAGTDDHSMFG